MASGSNTFGGTVRLSGESEYRKALSNISAQLKVVSTDLTKVTAEFGKNDNSIEGINDDIYSIKKALRGRSKNITLERQRIINLYQKFKNQKLKHYDKH